MKFGRSKAEGDGPIRSGSSAAPDRQHDEGNPRQSSEGGMAGNATQGAKPLAGQNTPATGGAAKRLAISAPERRERSVEPATMIPARGRRPAIESWFVRLVATGGIVAIGVVIGAVMVSQDVQGWIDGLVVSVVTVILAAVLWSSRHV